MQFGQTQLDEYNSSEGNVFNPNTCLNSAPNLRRNLNTDVEQYCVRKSSRPSKRLTRMNDFVIEDILCPLIAGACIQICPKNPVNFSVDNMRVAKLLGASKTFRGMVLKVDTVVGSIKRIENAKASVLVIARGVDTTATETSLIHKIYGGKKEDVGLDELGEGGKGVVSKIGEFGGDLGSELLGDRGGEEDER
ncbi:T-complex protein 1 subunit theta, partial [Tanacetum coccineum]